MSRTCAPVSGAGFRRAREVPPHSKYATSVAQDKVGPNEVHTGVSRTPRGFPTRRPWGR